MRIHRYASLLGTANSSVESVKIGASIVVNSARERMNDKFDSPYVHKDKKYVSFNPKILPRLSGHDKVLLLRDLYETKSQYDSVTVYNSIIKSDIAGKLTYQ